MSAKLQQYSTRILRQEEWPEKLRGTQAEVVQLLDGKHVTVVVVEDEEGNVVATWALMNVLHVECLWVHEEHRRRYGVINRLLGGMGRLVQAMGASTVWTNAATDDVKRMIGKLGGVPVVGESFILPMGGKE